MLKKQAVLTSYDNTFSKVFANFLPKHAACELIDIVELLHCTSKLSLNPESACLFAKVLAITLYINTIGKPLLIMRDNHVTHICTYHHGTCTGV